MSEKEFIAKIQKELCLKLGKDTQIKLQEVRKNNNVLHQGLIIQKNNSNIAPTIYMEAFYEMYEKGEAIEIIVERILQVYRMGEVKNPLDMDFFRSFDKVRDRIAYRLINAEKNKELLKDIPHILFMDLAICFYYAFYNEELGEGLIMIHNSHMEMWNTNHQDLMRLAQENTPKLFPTLLITLDAIIHELNRVMDEEVMEPSGFYVLTNRQKSHGAASILYPGVLEHIAQMLEGNFYVLPCSIHEVIIFKDEGSGDRNYLHEMITEANETQLLAEDILSDYPYYYNRSEKKLTQIRTV